MQTIDYALRAQKESDHVFLESLYVATRAAGLSGSGWDTATIDTFLRQQFQLQSRHYAQQFPDGEFWLIERHAEPIGRFCLYWGNTTVQLIDIALLPGHRGAGVGTALLRNLLARADARGLAVELHVEAHNPAQRLYQRLGFSIRDSKGVYLQMRRPARYGNLPAETLALNTQMPDTGQMQPES